VPPASSAVTASATRRVLPTPASPNSTAPRDPPSRERRRPTDCSSASRPTSGHCATTGASVPVGNT
jgi:hypothetical protein